MNYLSTRLHPGVVKQFCTKLNETFLDRVQNFDYTVFKHFKQEDQTTIQGINVEVKDKVLVLSKMINIQYNDNSFQDSSYGGFNTVSGYYNSGRIIHMEFIVKAKFVNAKLSSFTIEMGIMGSSSDRNTVFTIFVGDAKYLINSTFFDKDGFEAQAFQESTVDSREPFGLDYVLEIIQKLGA